MYLPDVTEDFNAGGIDGEHRYACSGCDGTAFGPAFGKSDGKQFLNICYGIYGDVTRNDNDYQVILQYDAKGWWDTLAAPLTVNTAPQAGAEALEKYFVYTGNTTYGVQNLLYDKQTGDWLAAVYPGKKPQFPNYTLFVIDGHMPPAEAIHGAYGEKILTLPVKSASHFPLGATGMATPHKGCYYFSQAGHDSAHGQFTTVRLYERTENNANPFTLIT